MVELKQFADGSYGLQGDSTGGGGEFIPVNASYSASSTSQSVFTASRNYIIKDISGRVDISGTGGVCTIAVYVAPSGTALSAGTLVTATPFNVAGVINTKQSATLSAVASNLVVAAGSSIGFVVTGTPTSAVGSLTVALAPSN